MSARRIVTLSILVILTAGVFAFYHIQQPVVSYDSCPLCDGNQYLLLYDAFIADTDLAMVDFPYYSRIIVPWIASCLPAATPVSGFQLINLFFSLLTVVFIWRLWEKLQLPLALKITGLVWLLFHWTGLIRLNAMDPVTVDVPTYVVAIVFILIHIEQKYPWFWILAPLAVFQKESFNAYLLLLVLYAIYENRVHQKNIPVIHIAGPLVASLVIKALYTYLFPPDAIGNKTALDTVILNFISLFIHPMLGIRWVAGVFMAFGAFIVFALLQLKIAAFKEERLRFLAVMSVGSLALSLVGGGDFTRLAFLGFPFIMTQALLIIKEYKSYWTYILWVLSIPLMRIFESIPDPGKEFSTFASWYPEFAEPLMVAVWICYLGICFLVLWLFKRFELQK